MKTSVAKMSHSCPLLLPECPVTVSTVCCLCRGGGGCLYTTIQWKTSTSVARGLKAANGTRQEKVHTTYQTMLTALPREHVPARGKRPRPFLHFQSSSSFPCVGARRNQLQ